MAEQAIFQPLADGPQYEKLRKSDVVHNEDCYGESSVDYDVDDVDQMSAAQWAELKRLREELGRSDATWTLRKHTAEPSCDCPTVIRYGLLCELTEGGYEFRREFSAPNGLEQDAPDED